MSSYLISTHFAYFYQISCAPSPSNFLILKTTSKFWKVIKVLASCHCNYVETSTSIKNDRIGSKPGSTLPHSDQSEARLSESIESLTTSPVRSIPDILVHLWHLSLPNGDLSLPNEDNFKISGDALLSQKLKAKPANYKSHTLFYFLCEY